MSALELLRAARSEPGTLKARLADYLAHLEVRGYSPQSVEFRAHMLWYFACWCEERGLTAPSQVTRPLVQRYQRHLFYYRKANGQPLTAGTQYGRLQVVQMCFRYLVREGQLPANPAADIDLPRKVRSLPKAVLTSDELEAVLALPDVSTPQGLRDRVMLEVLYATGLRRGELSRLSVWDIDLGARTLWVRKGKGDKDRVLPLSQRAAQWLQKYLDDGRPKLSRRDDEKALFLSQLAEPFAPSALSDLVRQYVRAGTSRASGSCHLFRHTMATAMLDGGADTRFIQAMLGHESLESTQLYTHVALSKLRAVYEATHPGARAAAPADDKERSAGPSTGEMLEQLADERDEEELEP
jgi:integrase/recombinase XerD